MQFRQWLENTNENQAKVALMEKLKSLVLKNYGSPMPLNVEQHLLSQSLQELERILQDEETKDKIKQQQSAWEKEKTERRLRTNTESYEKLWPGDGEERIVCSNENSGMEKNGMAMYPAKEVINDPALKQYYAIHTGNADEWLDHLVDDGYCDGDIYIYHIEIPAEPPFYVTEDPNTGGWAGEFNDKEVPVGRIIFSTIDRIPAQYIKLTKRITEREYWQERDAKEQQWGESVDPDQIKWWSQYAQSMRFQNEDEARMFIGRKMRHWNQSSPFHSSEEEIAATIQGMPLYRSGKSIKIGKRIRKPKFSWDNVDIRPANLQHLTTGGYLNMFDGPQLGPIQLIPIHSLHTTDSNQTNINWATELAEDIKSGDAYFEAIIHHEGGIVDGHHRLEAAKLLKMKNVPAQEVTYTNT